MKFETLLCEIAYKYGTDKCPQVAHAYTPIYYELLRDKRKTTKKVLELGIGSRETIQWVPDHYQTGASLLMWRDFFPTATIYGVDNNETAIFQGERIRTFLVDTTASGNLEALIGKIGADIDLVVDDGSHSITHQLRAARALMSLLGDNCTYIIEDARRPKEMKDALPEFDCSIFEFDAPRRGEGLVVMYK